MNKIYLNTTMLTKISYDVLIKLSIDFSQWHW